MTISRSGLNITIGGEIEDSVAAQITKRLTEILHTKASEDPLLTDQDAPAPTEPPSSDTNV